MIIYAVFESGQIIVNLNDTNCKVGMQRDIHAPTHVGNKCAKSPSIHPSRPLESDGFP
jgi:hypothetical protein